MVTLTTKAAIHTQQGLLRIAGDLEERGLSPIRFDRWVLAVIIPVALLIVAGLVVAWWITCQNKGMYPAFDMPSFQYGGTFKIYCAS